MAEIFDALFSIMAATCAGLLFYGGWLCLSRGRGKKEVVTAAPAAARSPTRPDKHSNQELTPAS